MNKIIEGPMLKKCVVTFLRELDFDEDEAMADLIASASAYVHGPWPEGLIPHLEATEQERWDSFKRYIKWRLENSVAGRIKSQLKEQCHVAEVQSA